MTNTLHKPLYFRLLIALSVFWLILDQGVKLQITKQLATEHTVQLIPDVLQLTLVYNSGAAFSLLNEFPAALLIIAGLLFCGFCIYAFKYAETSFRFAVALSLILGGALGNIIDRIRCGQVIDYIDFQKFQYPVFNLADAFIFSGVCLLIVFHLFQAKSSPWPSTPKP